MEKLKRAKEENNNLLNTVQELEYKLNEERKDKNKYIEEYNKLKKENINLNEECKDTKSELSQIKKELDELKRLKNRKSKHYMDWSGDELVDWIISIHGGKFKKYEQDLRNAFKKEGVNGSAIPHIDKSEWKSWGITNFMDRTNLDHEIKKLMNGDQQNDDNNEGVDGTPYI